MPIYEYQCEDCGERTEVLQRMSDPPLAECPACEGAVRKLISAPAFQFKGSGWYVTDYARGAGGKEAAAGGEGNGEGSGEGDGGDDSGDGKTDSKKESKSADSSGSPKVAADAS